MSVKDWSVKIMKGSLMGNQDFILLKELHSAVDFQEIWWGKQIQASMRDSVAKFNLKFKESKLW